MILCGLSASTTAGKSRGFGIRIFLPPVRMPSRQQTVKAKMWYSGSAQAMTDCSGGGGFFGWFSAGCIHASDCSTLATMLR